MRRIALTEGERGGPHESPFGGELRDAERAIRLWKQKAAELGRPPPASAFNFSQLATDSYRFFICADLLVPEDSVLILYGANFGKLFGLPERPLMNVPLVSRIPARYQRLFIEGCEQAVKEAMPVRFSGAVVHGGGTEVYRASFMPLRMLSTTLQFVYGSFNYRSVRDLTAGDRCITERSMELPQHGLQVE